MKYIILTTTSLVGLMVSCANLTPSSKEAMACTTTGGELYDLISQKIRQSEHARLLELDCGELAMIESYEDVAILLTSGRKEGKYVICLTNKKEDPCAHVIAKLIGNEPPSTLMSKVFGVKQQSSELLNETLERLFLRPSKLLKIRSR